MAAKTHGREAGAEKPRREGPPNIVFIMADQLAASFVGCYGSGVDSTPNIDRLARRGVRFERCYTHAPACAPNRAAMFTGRSLEIHGIIRNNLRLQHENPLFTQVLQTNGYRTGGFGKFHFTEMPLYPHDDMSVYGFDEFLMTEDPRFGHWLEWIKADHPEYYETALALCWPQPYYTRYGPDKVDLSNDWSRAYQKHLQPLQQASEWSQMYTSPLPKELQQAPYITNHSLDFLARHRKQHPDQPYFCFVSYVGPHDPYDPPEPYDTMFAPEDMKEPVPRAVDTYEANVLEAHRDVWGFREVADKPDVMKKLRAYYHGKIRMIDQQIGRLLDDLEQSGDIDNTVIVFTTDHGDMMGDHGLITKWAMHYENSIHCPLIVSGPGLPEGTTSDRLTSGLDFFPTFCDFADIDLLPPTEGKSFAGACRGETDPGWHVMTIELGPIRSIMTRDRWRLTHYGQFGAGQLFDLNSDPDEQRNLIDDPAYAKKRMALEEVFAIAYMQAALVPRYANLPRNEAGRPCLTDERYNEMTPLPW